MKINKKIFAGMAVLALLFGLTLAGCASKPAISSSGLYEYTLSVIGVKVATITDYLGTETSLVIPEQIDGYPLHNIKAGVFEGKSLNDIVFPEGIYSIGNRAFANNNLTSISIPAGSMVGVLGGPPREGITTIGESVFAENPIKSYAISGEIDCKSFDSLGSLTPYYYANGKKPGVYSTNGRAWEYNGSALTELPAMLIISRGVGLALRTIDGKDNSPEATTITRNNSGTYYTNDNGYWVPAGEHTLSIGIQQQAATVSNIRTWPTVEVRINFKPGIIYLFNPKEDKSDIEWVDQGAYSLSTVSQSQ